MTQFLPPNLLALFAPRDPIPYLQPASKLPHEKKNSGYIGVGGFLKYFEVLSDTLRLFSNIRLKRELNYDLNLESIYLCVMTLRPLFEISFIELCILYFMNVF